MTMMMTTMSRTRIDALGRPGFGATDLQVHGQAWDHVFILLAPPGPAEEPVGQVDDTRGLVGAVGFVGVLDGVGGDSALGVKGEDEQAGELVALGQIEDGLVAPEQLAQATIGPGSGDADVVHSSVGG